MLTPLSTKNNSVISWFLPFYIHAKMIGCIIICGGENKEWHNIKIFFLFQQLQKER